MITGTADPARLAVGAPTIAQYAAADVHLSDVVCLQLTAEMRNSAREALLPPALHPTVPAALTVQVWRVGMSPWGPFNLAVVRVGCRSGVRARGFVTGAVASSATAVAALRSDYGLPARLGEVQLRHGYDGAEALVQIAGRPILRIVGIDPEPMGLDDVQYTGSLNLAHTPTGLRLIQMEADHAATQVERLTPRLETFVGAEWGDALLVPALVVSASVCLESVVLQRVRFVCKVDELAFTGTEAVAGAAPTAA